MPSHAKTGPKIVTIFGGSGFVGRYIARAMARKGWRVRVAVRRPNEAIFVRPYGAVGQVEPIQANIRDDASTRAAISGANVIINCVGVLQEGGPQTFSALHAEGAARIARLAAEEDAERLIHVSAIGANLESDCNYAHTKARGEEEVLKAFPDAIILRPSLIFGQEDNLFNRFAEMSLFGPVLPLFGGDSLFQPVYVDDVARAAATTASGNVAVGIYELGGPDKESLNQLAQRMLHVIRRRRLVLNMPSFVGNILGKTLDLVALLSGGLFTNTILTADQVRMLSHDNVVSEHAMGFEDLDIEPTSMDSVLGEYLYRHRPQGQYTALTESAGNLKN
ncbi:MAG: complex I NDUFA9 subunit family protein [Rhodobacteraceae bacterium]|nr:complex I NDUFA9 subunit family protein [Paracoccaceae bacterium]